MHRPGCEHLGGCVHCLAETTNMGLSHSIDWENEPRLGQIPDTDLARELGVSYWTVRRHRVRLKKPSCGVSTRKDPQEVKSELISLRVTKGTAEFCAEVGAIMAKRQGRKISIRQAAAALLSLFPVGEDSPEELAEAILAETEVDEEDEDE